MEFLVQFIDEHWVATVFIFIASHTVLETICKTITKICEIKKAADPVRVQDAQIYYVRCKECTYYNEIAGTCKNAAGKRERWEFCSRSKMKTGV